MITLIVLYNVILLTILTIVGFVNAESLPHLVSSILFFPLAAYFWRLSIPTSKQVLPTPAPVPVTKPAHIKKHTASTKAVELELVDELEMPAHGNFDMNKRTFLRLLGSAGVSVFLLSVFTGKADAAFFGSVPGPGTVGVKDSSGTLIDPSEKLPTDGYNITEVDDSVPAYYGYVEKNGAWYIVKEDSAGAYRYAKGASNFASSWTGRAGLSYDYFNAVF